jgi:uncharacterized protein (DUF2147 family)
MITPMRSLALAVLTLIATFAMPAVAQPSDVHGLWLTKNRDARVRVADCGALLCGTIVWLAQPIDRDTGKPMTDRMNPDPVRRSRPMIGVRIFGMQKSGGNRWTGTIYNAEDGKTYSGSVQLIDLNRLKIEGCLGPFCDHEIWLRSN